MPWAKLARRSSPSDLARTRALLRPRCHQLASRQTVGLCAVAAISTYRPPKVSSEELAPVKRHISGGGCRVSLSLQLSSISSLTSSRQRDNQ